MADTISERILQNVETTLTGITTGNGYSVTVQQVYRNTDASIMAVTFPYIDLPEPQEDSEDVPLGLTTKFMHLTLNLFISNDTSPANKVMNNFIGDVVKALLTDHTRGGLAVDTDVKAERVTSDETAEPFLQTSMSVDIHYRHKYGDPTSLT